MEVMIGPLLLLALSPSFPPPTGEADGGGVIGHTAHVTSLARYAVKGLGPTSLTSVLIRAPGETFSDDRRFALLKRNSAGSFSEDNLAWLHKENFLCAFSDPDLMASFDCDYTIVGSNTESSVALEGRSGGDGGKRTKEGSSRRMITLYRRDPATGRRIANAVALGPVDLATRNGRMALGDFFSSESGEDVACVTASSGGNHSHQFGNTRSGVRERGDTRTIHLVNAATVRELSDRVGVPLNPSRFRPNLVVDGLEPWAEFGWVGRKIICRKRNGSECEGIELDVISRTVRCEGIGLDPTDPAVGKLDMPKLLQEHYPEHGPFLGVYAVISKAGYLELGDELALLHEDSEQARMR